MEGLGNDFVFLDDREGKIQSYIDYPGLAQKLCPRHFGIGADGIILILNADDHDIKFRIYNSDGSQAQMCGNGMRCFAKLLYEKNILNQASMRVDTKAGTVIPEVILNKKNQVESVKVDMGEPILKTSDIPFYSDKDQAIEEPLLVDDKEYKITTVSMGNPHAVIFVDDLSQIDIKEIGSKIETHKRFPDKTNVEFIEVVTPNELKMKVWERGAGITLACGTGACASLVAANLTGRSEEKAIIHLDGGDLEIYWNKETNHIFKSGPARMVFEGIVQV
jgi:diaminopimelate epimerase